MGRQAPGPAETSAAAILDAIVENSQDQLVYFDRDFNFVRVNRAYAETCRRRPEEFQGRNHFDLYPDAENQAIFERVRATGEPANFHEKPFVFPDQPERGVTYWDWTLRPVRDGAAVVGLVFSLRDVTDKVRARKAVEDSERRFRLLFETMSEGFAIGELILDEAGAPRDLRCVEVNPAFEHHTGLKGSEVVGRGALELFPDLEPLWLQRLGKVVATGEPAHFEATFGSLKRYFDVSAYRTGPNRVATVFVDITQRKQAEVELAHRAEAAQAKLAAIIESSHDAIIGKDLDGIILTWNAGAERVYGWTAREVIGRPIGVLAPPERAHETVKLVQRIRQGEEVIMLDTVRVRKDGQRIDVSLTLSPIKDAAGRVVGVSTIARDLSERQRAEAKLHAASLYARSLIEASLDPLVTISPEGKITDVNRATEDATGVPRERIVGTDFADYFTEPEKARAGYREVLARGEVRDYPLTIRHVSGRTAEVLYNATIYCGQDGERQGVFAAARDVTERKRAETERVRMEEQLRQAQKLEAVGRLAGGVAHDFNNLLTAIIGASDLLVEGLPATEPLRQEAADVKEAAKRAAALTRQLLTFSRKQVVQPRVLDLNEVVAGMDRMLRRLIGEDVELVARPARELGHVLADPGQIEQVIVNLALNARDAMPGGGRITLETANVELLEGDGLPPGRYVQLAVRDTGHGMTPDVLSHLFEPFFTTKGPSKGTGLGLSTVYGIAKQAGGEVRVRSEPGKGSAFEVYLPLVDAPAEGVAGADAGPMPRGTETVLLVEDEPMVRKLAARTLRGLGYAVREAPDGEAAWALAAGRTGELDLVVSDVVMPRLGGKELAERLRKERPGLGILFVSGYNEHSADLQGLLADGCSLLQKPFAPGLLARRVRELLDRSGRARSP